MFLVDFIGGALAVGAGLVLMEPILLGLWWLIRWTFLLGLMALFVYAVGGF